jgi:hypothetical protein
MAMNCLGRLDGGAPEPVHVAGAPVTDRMNGAEPPAAGHVSWVVGYASCHP